jgi:predicted NBD/HSP70 family sugar kinase
MTAAAGPADVRTIRRNNLRSVLLELVASPGSRAALAQRTGLTKATVAALVEPLIAQGILEEREPARNGRGRPSRELRFHQDGPVAVGVEVNVGYLAVTALSLDGHVHAATRVAHENRMLAPDALFTDVAELVKRTCDGVDGHVLGIGLAVPGVLDGPRLVRAPNLPQLVGGHPGEIMAGLLGMNEVPVDNEANLAARAHLWPHAVAGPGFVHVSGDIGVGAGIVIDDHVYRGTSGFAGELGHVVVDRDGLPCPCGGQGCLEQYAGLSAILRAAGQHDLAALLRALADDDPRAVGAVSAAGSSLGVALSSLLNVCDVPTVLLGGIFAELFGRLRPSLTAELNRRVLSTCVRPVEVRPSTLGSAAAARGAAAMIAQRACREPERLLVGERSTVHVNGDG